MNAVQLRDRADFYNDTPFAARFSFSQYGRAFNDAIRIFIDEMRGDMAERNTYSYQSEQQIRDNLYTLVDSVVMTTSNGAVIPTRAGNVIPTIFTIPTDFYGLINLRLKLNGYSTKCKPLTYSQQDAFFEHIHLIPRGTKAYYNEFTSGIAIYRDAASTLTQTIAVYIKKPAVFSLGKESQIITEAAAVLTVGLSYIALEDGTKENGVFYQSGDTFTAGTVDLDIGAVILASNTTTCNLPEKVHETICKMSATILQKTVMDYQRATATESEIAKNN